MNNYRFPGVPGILGPAGVIPADPKVWKRSIESYRYLLRLNRGCGDLLSNAAQARSEEVALAHIAALDDRIADASDGYDRAADESGRAGFIVGRLADTKKLRNYVVAQMGLPLEPL